jgi:hypothetical protein
VEKEYPVSDRLLPDGSYRIKEKHRPPTGVELSGWGGEAQGAPSFEEVVEETQSTSAQEGAVEADDRYLSADHAWDLEAGRPTLEAAQLAAVTYLLDRAIRWAKVRGYGLSGLEEEAIVWSAYYYASGRQGYLRQVLWFAALDGKTPSKSAVSQARDRAARKVLRAASEILASDAAAWRRLDGGEREIRACLEDWHEWLYRKPAEWGVDHRPGQTPKWRRAEAANRRAYHGAARKKVGGEPESA